MLVIRHASAGDSAAWAGDDRLRPLDARGFAEASRLVELVEDYAISLILSSPALRCVQTVEPLARSRALEIEVREELAEERQQTAGAQLVLARRADDAAVSVHGGLSEAAFGVSQKKGEVLVIDSDGQVAGRVVA